MKRVIFTLLCLIAAALYAATALADSSAPAPSPTDVAVTTVPPGCGKTYTVHDGRRLIDKAIKESSIHVGYRRTHAGQVTCAAEGNAARIDREWDHALAKHKDYVHAVLAYPGGRNPIGGNKWALPYCIVVGESGAGSGSSNLYGMLQGWAYAPSWAGPSAGGASFWGQSVAAYNLRQHGFGGWSTWPC